MHLLLITVLAKFSSFQPLQHILRKMWNLRKMPAFQYTTCYWYSGSGVEPWGLHLKKPFSLLIFSSKCRPLSIYWNETLLKHWNKISNSWIFYGTWGVWSEGSESINMGNGIHKHSSVNRTTFCVSSTLWYYVW